MDSLEERDGEWTGIAHSSGKSKKGQRERERERVTMALLVLDEPVTPEHQ